MGESGNGMKSSCPMCRGRLVNKPLARLMNPPCDYCGGKGEVDTDLICNCGRPAVKLVNEQHVCTRYECGKQAIEGKT